MIDRILKTYWWFKHLGINHYNSDLDNRLIYEYDDYLEIRKCKKCGRSFILPLYTVKDLIVIGKFQDAGSASKKLTKVNRFD